MDVYQVSLLPYSNWSKVCLICSSDLQCCFCFPGQSTTSIVAEQQLRHWQRGNPAVVLYGIQYQYVCAGKVRSVDLIVGGQ
jgi:hypothetical protein